MTDGPSIYSRTSATTIDRDDPCFYSSTSVANGQNGPWILLKNKCCWWQNNSKQLIAICIQIFLIFDK